MPGAVPQEGLTWTQCGRGLQQKRRGAFGKGKASSERSIITLAGIQNGKTCVSRPLNRSLFGGDKIPISFLLFICPSPPLLLSTRAASEYQVRSFSLQDSPAYLLLVELLTYYKDSRVNQLLSIELSLKASCQCAYDMRWHKRIRPRRFPVASERTVEKKVVPQVRETQKKKQKMYKSATKRGQ